MFSKWRCRNGICMLCMVVWPEHVFFVCLCFYFSLFSLSGLSLNVYRRAFVTVVSADNASDDGNGNDDDDDCGNVAYAVSATLSAYSAVYTYMVLSYMCVYMTLARTFQCMAESCIQNENLIDNTSSSIRTNSNNNINKWIHCKMSPNSNNNTNKPSARFTKSLYVTLHSYIVCMYHANKNAGYKVQFQSSSSSSCCCQFEVKTFLLFAFWNWIRWPCKFNNLSRHCYTYSRILHMCVELLLILIVMN